MLKKIKRKDTRDAMNAVSKKCVTLNAVLFSSKLHIMDNIIMPCVKKDESRCSLQVVRLGFNEKQSVASIQQWDGWCLRRRKTKKFKTKKKKTRKDFKEKPPQLERQWQEQVKKIRS